MIISWLVLLELIILLLLFFFAIPIVVQTWSNQDDWKDRLLISVIHVHVFIIFAVHLLVAVNLYELGSMFILSIFFLTFLIKRNGELLPYKLKAQFLAFLQATDQKKQLKRWRLETRKRLIIWMKENGKRVFTFWTTHSFAKFQILLLFICSAIIRFDHSLTHYYFPSSDPYVHLKWVKLLSHNELYPDGVYPFGFEAIISAIHVVFSIDPYYILRFLGPLAATFLVFTIYYVIRKHRPKDYFMPIFALFIYLVSSFQFGFIWRQYSSLSMEYGVIFVLPGIYFFIEYMRYKKAKHLILSLECFLLTLLIHPYAAVCFFVCMIVLFLFATRTFRFTSLLKMLLLYVITGVIGILPLALGLLSGKKFHSASIDFVRSSIGVGEQDGVFTWEAFLGQTEYGHLLSFSIVVLVMIFVHLFNRKKVWDAVYPFQYYVAMAAALFLFYKAQWLGLPTVMEPYRIEVTLILFTSICIASVFVLLTTTTYRTFFCVVILVGYGFISHQTIPSYNLPKGNMLQYDSAVEAYLEIKENYPKMEWTIISSVEEYVLALNYGWHYNLIDFIDHLSTNEQLTFPTGDVFLFVEKVPIGTEEKVTTLHVNEFGLTPRTEVLDYYRIPEYRRELHEQVWYWVEQVELKRPGLLKVFKETPKMTVYHLKQDPNTPYDVNTLWR